MARVQRLGFFVSFLLTLALGFLPRPAYAVVASSQSDALFQCDSAVAADKAAGNTTDETCLPPSSSAAETYSSCSTGFLLVSGYTVDGHGPHAGIIYHWCVPADCSKYSSGYSDQNWSADILDGDVRCSDNCMSVFHNTGAFNLCFSGGACSSTGYFVGNGNRCATDTDASFSRNKPGAMTCDHSGASCYNPDKGFCGTTESGESVCEKAPSNGAGGCASGATGATCVGNNTTPPPPSDPPIPKNQPPDSTATASGHDSGGNPINITQNNYSGTSPGSGSSGGSDDGSLPGSGPAGTGSNQTGSGNSPGPGGDHGTDTNGKCPDGSVPTASGCSGTASDTGCDTPPQCFGDAVLCASFKEQVAIRCNTKSASGSSAGGYGDPSSALAGAGVPADGGASGDPSASGLVTSSDLGEDGFDASGLGFSRSCPANPTFSVLGHSYTLDLTPFCNFAGMLGWFVLLVSMLVALRIVATGKA
jgi:hypothetical protein